MSRDHIAQMERSWTANAEAWTRAVRQGQVESRRLATDTAVVDAILERTPRAVLDIGCGEGWLARALSEHGVQVTGADASAPLIKAARARGGGAFLVRSYVEIAADPEAFGTDYDAVVFNFALLDEDPAPVLRAVGHVLAPEGVLHIQTVHPWTARGQGPYRDGWRVETFEGFGGTFPEPMPWYYRTLGSWISLLHRSGYRVLDLREPVHPNTGEPLSLLFTAARAAEPAVAADTGPGT